MATIGGSAMRFLTQIAALIAAITIAASASAAQPQSIYVKLYVGPASLASSYSYKKLVRAWNSRQAHHAKGIIYFVIYDDNDATIDQGKLQIRSQGRIQALSSDELRRAAKLYIGIENSGRFYDLTKGKLEHDGTAVINFVVTAGTPGYTQVPR